MCCLLPAFLCIFISKYEISIQVRNIKYVSVITWPNHRNEGKLTTIFTHAHFEWLRSRTICLVIATFFSDFRSFFSFEVRLLSQNITECMAHLRFQISHIYILHFTFITIASRNGNRV